jgi:hypothetical protein
MAPRPTHLEFDACHRVRERDRFAGPYDNSGLCSRCHQPTILDPLGYCQNVFQSGNVCDFSMPSYNTVFRQKWGEHTNLLDGRTVASHSWVRESGLYIQSFLQVCQFGSLFYDLVNEQPFLMQTPSGHECFANVMDTSTQITEGASGIIQPLNQKFPNRHPHFGNSQPWYISIASPPFLIYLPDRKTSKEVIAYKNDQPVLD